MWRDGEIDKRDTNALVFASKHRTVGHKNVQTTMIYLHVVNKLGIAVKSPADSV